MIDMSTIKDVAIAGSVAAIAVAAYLKRDKIKKALCPEKETPKKENKKPKDAMLELGKSFLRYADNFQGLYEPMYKASVSALSCERRRNVLMEWNIRMGNIGNIPINLKSWWSTIWPENTEISDDELQGRAQQVIQLLFSCGIVRDDRTELLAEEDTDRFYQASDDVKWLVGQKLRIESPCWFIQCTPIRIIEKGYCEIIN